MLLRNFMGGNSLGKATAASDTVINRLVPPRRGAKTFIQQIVQTTGSTAHVLTALRCMGRSQLVANAAASQSTIVLKGDPGAGSNLFGNSKGTALASGHYVAIRNPDETIQLTTVNGAPTLGSNGILTVVLTDTLTYALAPGADFWQLGIATSVDPRTGIAFAQFNVQVSKNLYAINQSPNESPLVDSGEDEPILIQSNNPTNAGTIESVTFIYGMN